jgi:hypothetical protein
MGLGSWPNDGTRRRPRVDDGGPETPSGAAETKRLEVRRFDGSAARWQQIREPFDHGVTPTVSLGCLPQESSEARTGAKALSFTASAPLTRLAPRLQW